MMRMESVAHLARRHHSQKKERTTQCKCSLSTCFAFSSRLPFFFMGLISTLAFLPVVFLFQIIGSLLKRLKCGVCPPPVAPLDNCPCLHIFVWTQTYMRILYFCVVDQINTCFPKRPQNLCYRHFDEDSQGDENLQRKCLPYYQKPINQFCSDCC